MKNKRIGGRLLCLLLVLIMVLPAGCGTTGEQTPMGPTVTDASGAVLALKENRQELTIASVYAVSVPFIKALGLTDRVKAINCKSNFWKEADEHLKAAGSVGRGKVDLEALASFAPDVLVHRSNDTDTLEAVGQLGVTLLCISAEDMAGIYSTLELMGTYFGVEERAAEVIAWMDAKFARIDALVADIPEEDRKTALVMGGELGRIAGGDMLQSWMIEKAGGVCVAKGIENNSNWVTVGVEKVFSMNPEVIMCTSSTALEYELSDMLEGPAWSAVEAVKNKAVYQIPSLKDSWDMPGISPVLGTMWMVHTMYPEKLSKAELEKEIEEYYLFLFGKTFTPETLGYELSF
ncbi:MAG: ABC transporter substrate-binding protein [Clostridia bacterium]|nr:ABC transporter substrate-binding protein [Clostridia bacterium]